MPIDVVRLSSSPVCQAGIYEITRWGQLSQPINHISHAEIPEAIDKLRTGGVIGRFIAEYKD